MTEDVTVGFYITCFLKAQVAALVYLANECLLRGLVWLGHCWGVAVLVRASSSNYPANRVPVPNRVRKSL